MRNCERSTARKMAKSAIDLYVEGNGQTNGFSLNTESFAANAVAADPEPDTYAMLLAGVGLLGFAARRRKLKLAA